MRLVDVEIRNFRRFRGTNKVNVDGKVIGFIGPNEAGKSSLLEVLDSMEDQEEFSRWQLTKGEDVAPKNPVVQLRFLLDREDRASLDHIQERDRPRWYVWWKTADGTRRHRIDPDVSRDITTRKKLIAELERLTSTKWFSSQDALPPSSAETEQPPDLAAQLANVQRILQSDEESLDPDSIVTLEECARELDSLMPDEGDRVPKMASHALQSLRRQIELEQEDPPRNVALSVLGRRRPQISLFGEPSRDLRSAYDLAEIADSPPTALANLANLADLNLVYLRDVAQADDPAEKETVLQRANEKLEEVFSSAWSQAPVTVRLTADATTLNVLVPRVGGGYSTIAERSDGLRAFVALVCHAALETKKPPILLIDEAERHLHYDAQADLMRMLIRQTTARQVIYTTHSSGCLPEDIGGSVRVVAQIEEGPWSTFENNIWRSGHGFSPLFVAMGASALAFSAARKAVIAEGISDVILLPALLRSALHTDELGFQVAPGLAEINRRSAAQLNLEGGRVIYVVDADEGGEAIARELRASGVSASEILKIGRRENVIEDAIYPELYIAAVLEEVRRSGHQLDLDRAGLPRVNRPSSLAQLCTRQGIPVPPKRAVAQRVVEMRSEYESVHDPEWTHRLVNLYEEMLGLLNRSVYSER